MSATPPTLTSSSRGLRRMRAAVLALGLGAGFVVAAEPAVAQTQDDLERARSLFRQGLALEAAGNWAAALAKFQEVGKVKLTPQVRFHSARCSEQLGRLNEALGEYRLAEYEAGQQGIPELAAITQSRQALEGRIPKLVIKRGQGAEVAKIQLDGVELGEAQIGQAVAVDPGPHKVVAKIDPEHVFEQSAMVKEGETAEVVLVAPEGAEGKPASQPSGANAAGSVDVGTESVKSSSALPWIVGGVGAAGLVASGVFYGLRTGAKSKLDNECHGSICPESLKDQQDKGQLYSTLSLVGLGVGVAGIGVATYLFVSGSGKSGKEQALALPIDVAALPNGGAMTTVRGRF